MLIEQLFLIRMERFYPELGKENDVHITTPTPALVKRYCG